jgi:hypothetical protein
MEIWRRIRPRGFTGTMALPPTFKTPVVAGDLNAALAIWRTARDNFANGVVGSEPASPFLRAVLEHASDEIRAGVRV